MKITHTTTDGRMSIEIEGDTTTIWDELSVFQEVFCEKVCGKCGKSGYIRFAVREAQDADGSLIKYRELICTNCRAKKSYGLSKDGKTLFPKTSVKRKEKALFERFKKSDEDKVAYLPDNGWLKYDPKTGETS